MATFSSRLPRPATLVEVWWEDAATYGPWEAKDDAKGWSKKPHRAITVGYIVERSKKRIVLAQSSTDGAWGNQWKIPTSMIQRIRILARAERGPKSDG